jgi:hypothetical protein
MSSFLVGQSDVGALSGDEEVMEFTDVVDGRSSISTSNNSALRFPASSMDQTSQPVTEFSNRTSLSVADEVDAFNFSSDVEARARADMQGVFFAREELSAKEIDGFDDKRLYALFVCVCNEYSRLSDEQIEVDRFAVSKSIRDRIVQVFRVVSYVYKNYPDVDYDRESMEKYEANVWKLDLLRVVADQLFRAISQRGFRLGPIVPLSKKLGDVPKVVV